MTNAARSAPPGRADQPCGALLLIGHGSARYPDAGRILDDHAATLLADGRFDQVAVAFLAGAPTPSAALALVAAAVVHVVPFFMDDGYFTRVAVPAALAGESPIPPRRAPSPRLVMHQAIGAHPGLPALITRRVRAAGFDPGQHALLMLAHGSARRPGRRMSAHDHADALRTMGEFPSVEVAFLEEPPLMPEAVRRIGDRPTLVLGLFAGNGAHARDDMPALLAAARAGRNTALVDLGIIGDDAGLAALILDLVQRSADA